MMNPTTPSPNEPIETPATPVTSTTDTPAPQAPETAPVAPIGPTPTPTPGNNKKLVMIASVIAGVVLLAVIAVFVYIGATSVLKQDYANAAKQYNSVSSANSELNRTVRTLGASTSQGTDEEFTADAKKVEDAIAKLKEENEKLGNEKASKVGEGKKLYDEFDTKLEAYAGYAQGLVTSITSIRNSYGACDEVSKAGDDAARTKALRECATALNTEADIPNASFKAYIDALKPEYEKYAKASEAMAAIENPYGANYDQYRTLRTEAQAARTKISEAGRNLSSGLNKSDDEMSVKDTAKALADYFNDQQRK